MNAPFATSHAATSHEHEWVLRGVEFEDAGSVNRYSCHCGQVWFE